MIVYNSNYEFVAISDSYVKKLNFPSFNAMKYRISGDFANLFIEKKGFVSNFKHILWIDYILQEGEKAKAILKGGDNNFYKITMSIENMFFLGDSNKGFLINITSITEYESDTIELEVPQHVSTQKNNKSFYSNNEDEFSMDYKSESSMFFDSAESQTFKFKDSSDENNINQKTEKDLKVEKENNKLKLDNSDNYEYEFEYDDYENNSNYKTEQNIKIDKNINDTVENEKSPKLLTSPDEFFKNFDTSYKEKETDNISFSQLNNQNQATSSQENSNNGKEDSALPLKQSDIDALISGKDIVVEVKGVHSGKTFSSDNYNLDDVSQELGISRANLIDFLIDFIHHANQIKKFVYEAIENNQIKNAKNVVFLIRGLALNLRIVDVYDIIEKILSKQYKTGSEMSKDTNSLYKKISFLNDKIGGGGELIKLDSKQVRGLTSSINRSTMPDILFQDLVDTFIKIFDNSKDKIESGFNVASLQTTRNLTYELNTVANSLSIDEIIKPLGNMISNIDSNDVKFEKLIDDWINLSNFVDKLR